MSPASTESTPMRIAMLHTRIRLEERMLLDAFAARGVEPTLVNLATATLDPASGGRWEAFDAVLDRSLSLGSSLGSTSATSPFT